MKVLWVCLLLWAAGPAVAADVPDVRDVPDGGRAVALRLEKGSIARNQLVAVDRDLLVAGDALDDATVMNGSIEVSGRVTGDIIVLRGDARLRPGSEVGGNVYVVGGVIHAEGARVSGQLVSYPTASAAWLTLIEGPSLGLPAASPLVVSTKIALLAAWAGLLLLLFAASGRQVLETADGVRREPFRSFFTGLTSVLALLLTALFFSAFVGGFLSTPLLVLVVLLALLLKLWGMVAVFHALGDWISRRVLHRHVRPLNAATIGLLVMGVLKFLPWVGLWTWYVATFIGVGASLATKFGRREPWFELA